jgi:hypothetical protein
LRLERTVVRHHRRRVEAEEADLVVPENRADGLSRSIRLALLTEVRTRAAQP